MLGLANSPENSATIYSYNTRTRAYALLRDFSGAVPEGEAQKLSKSPVDVDPSGFIPRRSSADSPASNTQASFDSLADLSSVLDSRNGISAAITSTGRYVYLGLHPGRSEETGWTRAAGVKEYRRTYEATGGPVEFVHYKGQELAEGTSPNLEPGEWHYDAAAGSLYLRLPDDSNPNSRSASDAAPIVGQWRTAAENVIRLPKSAASHPQVLDRKSASWVDSPKLRANVSRDGRFAIFGAGSSEGRKDVFIAALISPAAAGESLEWTNLVNCTAINNSIEKTGGQNQLDDASANSMQSIESGDGHVEFTASEKDKERWCGLTNANEIHENSRDINFAIRLNGNKKAEVHENGSLKKKVKYKNGKQVSNCDPGRLCQLLQGRQSHCTQVTRRLNTRCWSMPRWSIQSRPSAM